MRPDRLAKLGIARTLQGVGLFARLSALENVMAGAQPLPSHALLERAAWAAVV